jgi:hypothetical protein
MLQQRIMPCLRFPLQAGLPAPKAARLQHNNMRDTFLYHLA